MKQCSVHALFKILCHTISVFNLTLEYNKDSEMFSFHVHRLCLHAEEAPKAREYHDHVTSFLREKRRLHVWWKMVRLSAFSWKNIVARPLQNRFYHTSVNLSQSLIVFLSHFLNFQSLHLFHVLPFMTLWCIVILVQSPATKTRQQNFDSQQDHWIISYFVGIN